MSKKIDLSILQINDSHAYFELHNELFWIGDKAVYEKVGGYARIATLFQNIREEKRGKVIVLDNGDTIHGTFAAVNSQGKALIPILNELGIDAMTVHWEFAYGPQNLKEIGNKLNFPLLAINCFEKKSDNLVFPPFRIIEIDGLKIGIIGIAATIIDKTMPDHFSEGIYFTLGNEELPEYITKLRIKEKVDLIIVLSHLGFPQEVKLAKEVDGIDILLSGHTHNRLYKPVIVNGTIIIQSGCHGSFLGKLDLEIENNRVCNYNHRLIKVEKSIKPDPKVESIIEKVLGNYRSMLNTVVGKTLTALNRNMVMESTMDNFLLQALSEVTGEKIVFSNGWRYGVPIIPGQILMNDLWNIIPTNPKVSICKINGAELFEMMEENLERTFSSDPYKQMGGYVKRCLGMNIYFKVENPEGTRIQEFYVNGKKLTKSKTYNACFVTTQGVPEKYGKDREKLDLTAIEALEGYLEKHDSVSADLRKTIVPI
jgi:2',3'-cyclic-nucleotide 2'-phosphodiesterase (5'-nucleotidase family)